MRYLMEPTDLFSVVNHPWQPTLQHLHVLVAPLMVFAVGLIWKKHIAALIRKRKSAEKQQESPNLERQPGYAVTH